MSSSAYQQRYQNVPQGGNPRQTEAWALTEAARRMKEAQAADPFELQPFLAAVRLNWRLWTIFQAELCNPETQVPAEVRTNMLALSNFVDKTTVAILARPSPEKVGVLININREIAAGLFADPNKASPEAGAAEAREETPSQPPSSGGLDFSA